VYKNEKKRTERILSLGIFGSADFFRRFPVFLYIKLFFSEQKKAKK
jgi:hypothetical protein